MMIAAILAFVLILAVAFIRRTDWFEDLSLAVAMPIVLVLLTPIGLGIAWLRPVTIDAELRAIDLALGMNGFALTRFVYSHVVLVRILAPVYNYLPLAIAFAWVVERPKMLLRAAVIGAICAVPFYLLFPAVGPKYAFAGFPSESAHALPVIGGMFIRNCMPSMHCTWTFLLFLNLYDRRWRWVFAIYAGLMCLATVASGEHYFIDVIAAVPFTFAMQWLAHGWPLTKNVPAFFARPRRSEVGIGVVSE